MGKKAMDLTQGFPRSPYEKLSGMVHLPRMTDKARAKGAGLLGEYIYPCPLDQMLLAFMGMDPKIFFEAAQQKDDQEMSAWVQQKAVRHTSEEIEQWNRAFLNRGPVGEEQEKRFLNSRARLAPDRTDITAWVDLMELDEGRAVPIREGMKWSP